MDGHGYYGYRKLVPVRPWSINKVAKNQTMVLLESSIPAIPGPNFLATWKMDHDLTGKSLRYSSGH